MEWKYDAEVDAAYLAFIEIPAGGVARSVAIDTDIVLDFGKDGHLLGVEVMNASYRLHGPLVNDPLLKA